MKPMNFDLYIEYINNKGGSVTIEQFDIDWDPLGPMLRLHMKVNNIIKFLDGKIYLEHS
jgi:hypothetical protein